jgi:hypothetical protein
MQAFTLALICVAMLSDFLVAELKLPPLLRYVPEMTSAIVVLYVIFAGTLNRFRWVAPKYWLVCGALVFVIICGVINNDPGSGPVITGMRFYFKAAPLFFLAMVMPLTEQQLKRQLMLILGLCFLQLPITIYQRWVVISAERWTGDVVRGTLMDSGILSMFLICAALVWTGFLLKHRVSVFRYMWVFLLLLFPTTINETKVTVLFVPFGMFITLVLGAERGKRLRYAGLTLAALLVFGAIFVPVYDQMEAMNPKAVSITDFFTNEKTLNNYLVSHGDKHVEGIGSDKQAHRGDAIAVPLKYLAKDPVLLAFGLGLGNVSPSQTSKNFEGRYFLLFQSFLSISFAPLVLEFGLFGIALIALLNWLIFADSLYVARRDDSITAALAAGWPGVVGIFMVALFYNAFHYFTAVTYMFWYLSGVICARRVALVVDTVPQATKIKTEKASRELAVAQQQRKSALSQRIDI